MLTAASEWTLSHGADPRALAVVDGLGPHAAHGPHYSRRTPGSRWFTGVGREVVLVTQDGTAVWAVVLHRAPAAPGTAAITRPRLGAPARQVTTTQPQAAARSQLLWRNVVFRNLGSARSSDLIRAATADTYWHWIVRYGSLPQGLRLRTEVCLKRARERGSTNPGYCYLMAGWERGEVKRGKLHLWAPRPEAA